MPATPRTTLGLLLTLAFTAPVHAVDRFVCDCATGADSECVLGDDAADGATPGSPWRSYERARIAWPALAPGDTLSFCRGGVIPVSANTQWINVACQAAQPCVIGAYSAPWGDGDEDLPQLAQTDGHGFAFVNAGSPMHEEGVVLRDLELSCSACGSGDWGIFLFNDIDDLRMERLRIRGFSVGVHLAGANACAVPGCDRANERVALVDSELIDNQAAGWLGADQQLLLEGNRFLRNGTGTVFEHNLYLTQSGGATQGIRVLRNELYRSASAASGRCEGGSFAAHGEHDDLLIEGNFIHEDVGATAPTCWGLGLTPAYATPEAFERAIIRGNRIRDVGNVAIAIGSCIDCLVENNIIESSQAFGGIAILAPAVMRGDDDAVLTGLQVRNNSIRLATPDSVAIRVGDEGAQHVIVSNAIQGSAASGAWACLALNLAPTAYAQVDHNVCGFVAGAGREWEQGSGSLEAWRLASGHDAASILADPGFAAPGAPQYDLRAASASAPMVGAGAPAASAPTEYYGVPRGTPPDAGAHQYGIGPGVFANGFEG